MWSLVIVGSSALTNQSDTNAAATPASDSRTRLVAMLRRGGSAASSAIDSDLRY